MKRLSFACIGIAALATLTACGGGGGGGGALSCADAGVCPPGYSCSPNGVCLINGAGGTGGGTAGAGGSGAFGATGGSSGSGGSSGVGGVGAAGGVGGSGGGATCGNGQVESPEQCDTSGESASCDSDCTAAQCGDGTLNGTAGEQCDSSGQSVSCDSDCTTAQCGDGTINSAAGEQCDSSGESASCDSDCTSAQCGDGTLNTSAGEQCDGSGQTASCDADCTPAQCGDGTVNAAAGEQCDSSGASASCDGDCSYVQCGDGTKNTLAGEECDDFNQLSGDGCSSSCKVESAGENCSNPITVNLGLSTINWSATAKDYVPSTVSCATSYSTTGPDVVLKYTASFTGTLSIKLNKPASTRWVMLTDDYCGYQSSPLSCTSDFSATSMTGSISVVSGQSYYIYVVDTTSGTNPLSNPFTIELSSSAPTQTGESCTSAIPLTLGTNTINWTASVNNYVPSTASCATSFSTTGPDVVLEWTASFTGTLYVSVSKPTSTRWVGLIDDYCGYQSSSLTCFSEYSLSTMSTSQYVYSGTKYYFYLIDTTSGTNPLSNPLSVTLSQ